MVPATSSPTRGNSALRSINEPPATAFALFVNFLAALEGAQHRECRGIRAIIPPRLRPGIGKFICEIQRALSVLLAPYATVLKFPDREWLHVGDFFRIERKRFHAALQETDWIG